MITQQKVEMEYAHSQLTRQHAALAEKNKSITDSIRYAQIIQKSILPSRFAIEKLFPEFFLIYRAKDIVSGDFYFISEVDNGDEKYKVVVVADCTGHGVPGAFMSMIGYNILNHCINEKKLTSPATILKQMNLILFQRLNSNKDKYLEDGMDVGICFIHQEGSMDFRLRYASAKHKLWINHADKSRGLEQISGDRHWIGGTISLDSTFTNQEVVVQKGSQLYFATDGFSDQNNYKRKKFSTKRLKALLSKAAGLSMNTQGEILTEALETHQGAEFQRDDITVLGIQI